MKQVATFIDFVILRFKCRIVMKLRQRYSLTKHAVLRAREIHAAQEASLLTLCKKSRQHKAWEYAHCWNVENLSNFLSVALQFSATSLTERVF